MGDIPPPQVSPGAIHIQPFQDCFDWICSETLVFVKSPPDAEEMERAANPEGVECE